MSEKQFDHIENRIREAAENSEPAFDEYAWTLMEKRLDAEDKRRRRPFFWVIACASLLVVGGSIYFLSNNHSDEIQTSQQVMSPIANGEIVQQKNVPEAILPLVNPISDASTKADLNKHNNTGVTLSAKDIINNNDVEGSDLNGVPGKKGQKTKGKLSSNINVAVISGTDDLVTVDNNTESNPVKPIIKNNSDSNVTIVVQNIPLKKDTASKNINKAVTDSNSSNKIKESKTARFYLLASAGIDAGSVKFLNFENSKVTAKYGIGIGYQLSKRMSVQSGFYASRKKYIAGPDDYNAKPGSYWSMVQIVKIDASCLVYDVPLTFRFDFLQKPKTTYYATAGVSSYIMKKEDYNYYYNRYNMAHEVKKSYSGNKDLFAVFNLSAGIEKKLSPQFFMQAEPSIGIPLSGVGEGSVKLYSAALQVAIKYQPVKKH